MGCCGLNSIEGCRGFELFQYMSRRVTFLFLLGRDLELRHVIAPSPHVPRPTWVA